jgi:small subunit ribosomal protein S19
MSRSKWKHPFVHRSVRKKVKRIKEMQSTSNSKRFRIKTMSRSSQITKDFIDISFMVHDGRDFRPIIVTEDMVGHKFGEFVYTRQRYSYKKKK